MWTDATRRKHARKGLRYSSDMTDAEWAVLEPHCPAASRLGRPRKWTLHQIVDALLYNLRSGLPWRMLPKDFPPVSTVQRYFYAWRDSGLFQKLNHLLLMEGSCPRDRTPLNENKNIMSQSLKSRPSPRTSRSGNGFAGRSRFMNGATPIVGSALQG